MIVQVVHYSYYSTAQTVVVLSILIILTVHVDVGRIKTHVEQECLVAAVAMLYPTNLPLDGTPLLAAATARSALHTQARLLEDAARTKLAVATALATHTECTHTTTVVQ